MHNKKLLKLIAKDEALRMDHRQGCCGDWGCGMTDLRTAAQAALDAQKALLALIRREAPHLSGKLMGHCDNVCNDLRAALAQPEQQALSQRMRAAGFTPRDTRLTCDECGAKYTPQMAPLHECAQPEQQENNNE